MRTSCRGRKLASEARGKDRELLAHRRRRRGLPMGACQHRHPRIGCREAADPADQVAHRRHHDFVARPLQHRCVGEVVDVLRRACEVHVLRMGGETLDRGDPLLDEILHGLHVVVGPGLDGAYVLRVHHGEVAVHGPAGSRAVRVGHGQFDDGRRVRQMQEPLDFDPHARAYQAELGDQRRQRRDPRAVAPVERRNGSQGRQLHRGLWYCKGRTIGRGHGRVIRPRRRPRRSRPRRGSARHRRNRRTVRG